MSRGAKYSVVIVLVVLVILSPQFLRAQGILTLEDLAERLQLLDVRLTKIEDTEWMRNNRIDFMEDQIVRLEKQVVRLRGNMPAATPWPTPTDLPTKTPTLTRQPTPKPNTIATASARQTITAQRRAASTATASAKATERAPVVATTKAEITATAKAGATQRSRYNARATERAEGHRRQTLATSRPTGTRLRLSLLGMGQAGM